MQSQLPTYNIISKCQMQLTVPDLQSYSTTILKGSKMIWRIIDFQIYICIRWAMAGTSHVGINDIGIPMRIYRPEQKTKRLGPKVSVLQY